MSKYLIQDIIPPEKKHSRGGVKKTEAVEHDIVHPEHPIRREKTVKRGAAPRSLSANPRRMIVDQVASDETEHEEPSRATEVTHESVEVKIEKAPGEMSGWPSNFHSEETSVLPKNTPPRFPNYPMKKSWGGLSRWLPWLIGAGVVVIASAVLLNFFAGATVTIAPKHDTLPMDQKMSAQKNGAASDLPYAVMKETLSSSLEVPATGEKTVTAKASGRIVVYNEQLVAQRLIKNTRFQSPTGKIYRINESINVPKGATKGASITPGFFEVTVYADEAGPEYNSPATDFTLPGLKSSSLYTKVYARGKGAMTGGARGTIKTVSDQDLKQAGEDLRVQLEMKLRSKVRGALAPFQIAYDQGIVVELGEPALAKAPASSDNKAIVSEEGTIYMVTFKREDLIRAIAKALVPTYKNEPVEIKNLESLQFGMDPEKGSTLVNASRLDFTLKGTPELAWVIDEEAIKNALLGNAKENFNGILAEYPSVDHAEANIRPMWKHTFPADPSRISVVLSGNSAK